MVLGTFAVSYPICTVSISDGPRRGSRYRVRPLRGMQDDRPTKLLRLSDFRRGIPHVSQRALTAILERVRADGVPALTTRKNQREARDMIAYKSTPYGPCSVRLICAAMTVVEYHYISLTRTQSSTICALKVASSRSSLSTVCSRIHAINYTHCI